MAQKFSFTVTAKSIVARDGSQKLPVSSSATQTVGVLTNEAIFLSQASGGDTLIILPVAGYQILAAEDFSDFATAISATSITGS